MVGGSENAFSIVTAHGMRAAVMDGTVSGFGERRIVDIIDGGMAQNEGKRDFPFGAAFFLPKVVVGLDFAPGVKSSHDFWI